MSLSIFDLFKVGIGPSSSHTVGPMWAANRFILGLDARDVLRKVVEVEVGLYGSLALTGHGHATDTAVFLGLLENGSGLSVMRAALDADASVKPFNLGQAGAATDLFQRPVAILPQVAHPLAVLAKIIDALGLRFEIPR